MLEMKIFLAFAAVLFVVAAGWQAALLTFTFTFLLALLAGVPIRIFLKRLRYPLFMAFVVSAVHPFTFGSTVVAEIFSMRIYSEGIYFGLLILLRIFAAVSVLNLLALTTPLSEVTNLKLPPVVASVAVLMLRYIFVFSEEGSRIYKAQVARQGYSGYARKIQDYATLAGMLILRSLDRAAKVHKAMLSRCYDGS